MEIVPGVPSPVPFPHPYVGIIEPTPIGTLVELGLVALTAWAFDDPAPKGPVFVNGFPATKIGDEGTNKITLPHFVIPPGSAFVPLPAPLKLKPPPLKPGEKLPVSPPGKPPGDAVFVSGSKTVHFEGKAACRLGTIAMSCSDPVRLPSSVLIALPKGPPVLIGGPDAFDWSLIAKTVVFRNKWMAGALRQIIANRFKPGRWRSILEWGACQLTGHPVDVATGRLMTRADDFTLRGPIPITFERFYSSACSGRHSPLGYGWSHTLHEGVWTERGKVVYKAGDGREIEFHAHHLPGRRMRQGDQIFDPISRLTLGYFGEGRYEIRSQDGRIRDFLWLPGNTAVSFLRRIRDRLGHFVDFEYGRDYLLEVVRSSEGRWIRLDHEHGLLRRVAVAVAEGSDGGWYDQVTFEYSADGDLVAARDSQKHARTYQYDNHLLIRETDRDGVSFWFEYDGRDENASCIRTWGNDGKGQDRLYFREITYDKRGHATFVEDSLGETTVYKMDALNAVVEIVDPFGASTKYEYNDFFWRTAEIDALGHATRFEYDHRGNETKRTLPNGGVVTVRYNSYDQPEEMTSPLGARWTWVYDALGRVTVHHTPTGGIRHEYVGKYLSRASVDGRNFTFEHDAFGEISKVTFPNGATEERWFDRQGRLVKLRDGTGKVYRVAYDWESRAIQIDEPGGVVRRVAYSPEGDVLAYDDLTNHVRVGYCGYHKVAWNTEGRSARVEYRYTSEDELIAVVNEAGETYSFVRDACGLVIEEVGFDGRKHVYARDVLGQVIGHTRPSKGRDQFDFDSMGLIVRATYADGNEETFTYDLMGQLQTAANAAGELRIRRDHEGRIIGESFGDDWIASRYDGLGGRAEVTTSLGLVQTVSHTPAGDVAGIALWERDDGRLRNTWSVGFQRDRLGNERERRMPGGIVASMTWNDAGLPVAQRVALRTRNESPLSFVQTVTDEETPLSQVQYAWSGDAQLYGMRRHTGGHEKPADTWYHHDDRGRLLAATLPDSSMQWHALGPIGNLFRSREQTDRQYGRAGILLAANGTRFEYDLDGNLEKKTAADGAMWAYAWNANGTLAHVVKPDGSTVAFQYDALGRRVFKVANGKTTRWLWDGDQPVHEIVAEGGGKSSTTTWIFDADGHAPLAKVAPDGARYSVVTDYLGTPTEMFDAAGALAWRAQLDIYGVAHIEKGNAPDCPWRSPGQYEDEETGLRYTRFRYFDPERGDFISQDPIRLAGGTGLYAYVDDPLTLTDPFGLAPRKTGCVGEYRETGGHHVHAKAAFLGHMKYNPRSGFSLGNKWMKKMGLDHDAMTVMQRKLFDKLAAGGKKNTLKAHSEIARKALIAGGASPKLARELVKKSLANLKEQGVKAPTRIPWDK